MRKFKLPLFDQDLWIFEGEKDWKKFKAACVEDGANPESRYLASHDHCTGRTCGNNIWLESPIQRSILIHEVTHWVTNIIEWVALEGDEVRAYITAHMLEKVLKSYKGVWK